MKKMRIPLIIMLLFISVTTVVFMATAKVKVQPEVSTVEITISSSNYTHLKAVISKDSIDYIYGLVSDVEILPLQMGSGKYEVSVFGSNDGRRFRVISKQDIKVTLEENIVFLTTSQTVAWDTESAAAVIAKDITVSALTDREKFDIVHSYVINNISYDYEKASRLPKGYIPNADLTLGEGQGICYDFAALTASMLRSLDIPTKLVKGYSAYTSVYHAWNEVLIDGEWIVVDSSTDSIFVDANVTVTAEKDPSHYLASKVY